MLLIVDDEQNVLYSLNKGLHADGNTIVTAATGRQAIELVRTAKPDAVLLDVRLPDMSGLETFDQMRQIDSHLPVIIMTAHGTTEMAIEVMKRGAFDYLLKPVKLTELRTLIAQAIEVSRLSRVPAVFEHDEGAVAVDRIVGQNAAMQRVYKDIGRVAGQDVNVLILGESGTGKELIARAIFQHSPRSQGPFLAVNAAAIPETLLESELLGHERGAFTGADQKRLGKFEQADQGTLFLDEIGDMPLSVQAKVLRVLQDGRFERVGGNETIQTDVRVLAATNQNLDLLVDEGRFRLDLYFRLKVFTIYVPPLRKRLDDLPMLLEYLIKLYNRELNKHVQPVADPIVEMLCRYDWPGNVRELQSAVKFALVRAPGNVLTADCFPDYCRAPGENSTSSPMRGLPTSELQSAVSAGAFDVGRRFCELIEQGRSDVYHTIENEIDRFLVSQALQRAQGNQVEASRLLGISRTTLRAKLDSLGLSVHKQVQASSDSNY